MCPSWVFCCAPLARYPSWVSCCAFWPDDGHPLHSAHCVRNRVPSIRFDAISQFAASVLYSDTSLIPPLPIASFYWLQIWFLLHCECGTAWAACGIARHARNYRQFLLSPSPLFLASSIFSSCLLRACFESTVGAFLSNWLLLDIWSELSTFWHKFAVVHDKECIVPAFGKS